MPALLSTNVFAAPFLWPTPTQELLLRAALLAPDQALPAWRQWRDSIDLKADFDRGSFRLLPLLYHRLQSMGVQDPLMHRLKGVYRQAWCTTQQFFHHIRPFLAWLQDQGMTVLLLKGVPLALQYYTNPVLRPMSDLDFLVHPCQAQHVIRLMEANGWQRYYRATDEDIQYRHAMQFGKDGVEVDVHWHVLVENTQPDADANFWDSGVAFDCGGVPTRCLDATHNLLHTIIHGVRWNPEPPIRWIADAMVILRSAEAIHWDRLLQFVQQHALAYRFGLGLRYLKERLEAPIPAEVLQTLATTPVTLLERMENTCVLHDWERLYQSQFGTFWILFVEYCRYAQDHSRHTQVVGLPHYFRYRPAVAGTT